jgi:hypothetical protein
MKRTKILLAFSLFFGTTAAFASTWFGTAAGNDDTYYFFDADSVEKNREITTVWIKTVQIHRAEDDGSWATAYRWRMNCSKKTIQTLTASIYDKDAKFIKSFPNAGRESEVVPDSTGEAMLKLACTADFPKSKSGKGYWRIESNDIFQATRNYAEYLKSQKDTAPQ